MAVDMIARMMAMGNGGGTSDAYTKAETDQLLDGKVDVESGKGLSANDFTDAYKAAVDGAAPQETTYTKAETDALLSDKVDKVTGKGLSTNDYTTAEKDKLAGVASGAEVNVQADWNQTDSAADDYIKNKPTIQTVNDATLTIQKNGTAVGTFSANAATAATINITVPVDAADISALPDTTKYGASLSLSIDSTTYVVTVSLKDQDGNTLGTAQTIDLPLETVVVGGSYDDTTKKVILTLKNGNTIDFSIADLVEGLQTEITSTNKLDADLVDDATSVHKFVTAADKTAWNAKSDFSGDYDDLTNKPTLGTAAAKGVDTAPTASSTNLVESGGVRNVVDVLEQMNGAKNRVNINVSEVKSLNSALGYTWNRNSCTVNGVTFTINNDNTITTSGATQSGEAAIFTLCDFGPDGTSEFYGNILSGCACGGNYSTSYSLYLVKPDGNTLINNDNYNSAGTEIPKTGLVRYLRILFRESTSADNLTFKPMICTKAAWDAGFTDFQPYALPVTTLTPALIKQVDEGAKNLAKFDIWAKQCSLVRGTKTIGSDGAITITATSSDCYTLFGSNDFPVECRVPVTPGQEMVATWTASMTGSGNKYLYIFPNGGITGSIAAKASDGIERFTVPENCTYITWRIGCSTSGDTLTINNLMICTAADYDASSAYVPYAPTNRELYEMILALQNAQKGG